MILGNRKPPEGAFFKWQLISYYLDHMERLIKYFRDTAAEMKHVKWPTSAQAISYTILVIVLSVVVALMLSGFDYLFSSLLEKIVY